MKVQTQAVAAMTAFIKGLEDAEDEEQAQKNKEVLLPYADELVNTIGTLLGKSVSENYRPLQEEVLAALSCLASLLDTNFEAHYGKFMPGLVQILQTAKAETEQEQQLRASCYECIGHILTSVRTKPEVCKNDAIAITGMIVEQMKANNMQPSDPQINAMTTTLSQICICLGEDFKAFLPTVVPFFLNDMAKDVKFSFGDAKEAEEVADDQQDLGKLSLNLKIRGLEGAKTVTMDTFALESKVHALNIVKTIARNMETNFFEYVEPVAQLCLEKLMNDRLNTAVRVQSAKCMRFMIGACENQPEKMKQLFLMSYAKLLQELEYFVPKQKVADVNVVLKELFKHMRICEDLGKKGVTLFTT